MQLGKREAGTDQPRGVHVVPTGVRDARTGAHPRIARQVLNGQRVEVSAERHDRAHVADLGDQAARRHRGDRESSQLEALGNEGSGALLVPGELGVGMQVATQLEELCLVRLDRGVDQVVRSSSHIGARLVDLLSLG